MGVYVWVHIHTWLWWERSTIDRWIGVLSDSIAKAMVECNQYHSHYSGEISEIKKPVYFYNLQNCKSFYFIFE